VFVARRAGDEAATARAIDVALDVWKLSRELTAVP
jgi:hypothetical protein